MPQNGVKIGSNQYSYLFIYLLNRFRLQKKKKKNEGKTQFGRLIISFD